MNKLQQIAKLTQVQLRKLLSKIHLTPSKRRKRRAMKSNLEQNTEPNSDLRNAIITMTIESWRFSRTFDRLLTKLEPGEQERYKNQLRWFMKKLEETLGSTEMKLVNIEGKRFDSGTAVTPLNIEDFDAQDELVVEQMLEPIIMGKNGIIKTGTVLLRKVEI